MDLKAEMLLWLWHCGLPAWTSSKASARTMVIFGLLPAMLHDESLFGFDPSWLTVTDRQCDVICICWGGTLAINHEEVMCSSA